MDGTNMYQGISKLTVTKANQVKDQGKYSCFVEDSAGYKNRGDVGVIIYKNPGQFLNLLEANAKYKIEIEEGRKLPIQWILDYSANPKPGFFLIKNDQILYPSSNDNNRLKYEFKHVSSKQVRIRINNYTIEDSGTYIFRADNDVHRKELKLYLAVLAPPKVYIENVSVMAGQEVNLKCQSRSNPPSEISWAFLSCPTLRNCTKSFKPASVIPITTNLSDIMQIADIKFTPTESGLVMCYATNNKGSDTHAAEVRLNDVKNEFEFLNPEKELVQGEPDVNITCAASVYIFDSNIELEHNGKIIEPTDNINVLNTTTRFSFRKTIHFKILGSENSGQYKCYATRIDNGIKDFIEMSNVVVHGEVSPIFFRDSKYEVKDVAISEPFIFQCMFYGTPLPKIEWYKDEISLVNNSRINFFESNIYMNISHIAPEDGGEYKCVGTNRLGSDSATLKLRIKNLPMTAKYWLLGLLLVILILAVLLIIFWIRIRRARAVCKSIINFC